MNTFIQLIHRLFISASSCHSDLVKTWTVRDFYGGHVTDLYLHLSL